MGKNPKRIDITDPETGEVFELNASSLVSDTIDVLMSWRRNVIQSMIWDQLSENQQQEAIGNAESLATDLVTSLVEIIATGGNDVIHALLDNFKIKDGTVTVTAKGIADDAALLALNSVGKKALKIVVADAEQFDQTGDRPEATPDQPSMDLDGDEGEGMSDEEIDDIASDMDTDLGDIEEPDDLHDEPEAEPASDERVEGYHARMQGQHSQRNPYDMDTPAREEWYLGWKRADDDDVALDVEPWPPEDDGKSDGEAENVDAEAPEADTETAPADAKAEIPDMPPREAGQQARVKGDGPDDNPYDGGTDEHAAWAEGYTSADAEIQTLIDDGKKAGLDGAPKKDCPWKKGTDGERFWLQGYEQGKAERDQG